MCFKAGCWVLEREFAKVRFIYVNKDNDLIIIFMCLKIGNLPILRTLHSKHLKSKSLAFTRLRTTGAILRMEVPSREPDKANTHADFPGVFLQTECLSDKKELASFLQLVEGFLFDAFFLSLCF